MFSCCRCANPKKQKYLKNGNDQEEEEEEEEEEDEEEEEEREEEEEGEEEEAEPEIEPEVIESSQIKPEIEPTEVETGKEDSVSSNNKCTSSLSDENNGDDTSSTSTVKRNDFINGKLNESDDEKQLINDNVVTSNQQQSETDHNESKEDLNVEEKSDLEIDDNEEKEEEAEEEEKEEVTTEIEESPSEIQEKGENNEQILNDDKNEPTTTDTENIVESTNDDDNIEEEDSSNENVVDDTTKTNRSKSDSSNSTIEESIVLNKKIKMNVDDNDEDDNDIGEDEDDDGLVTSRSDSIDSVPNDDIQILQKNEILTTTTTSLSNDLDNDSKDDIISCDTTIINGDLPKSCISRRSSSKSSIQKRVNINDSTEVIPSSERASIIDDDEVFSDSIPPQLPRGDMCAPYIAKRGSIPTYYGLPDWFNNDERFYNERGGNQEPPVTPVGRDELALKRHRMYSELLMAAQAAVEHRVRFDPLGPDIATTDCDPDLKPSTSYELENLVNRLEKLIDRLERTVSARELEIANKTFDSVIETKRRSIDLENTELPPIPNNSNHQQYNGINLEENNIKERRTSDTSDSDSKKLPHSLEARIDKIEASLNHINNNYTKQESEESSLENIPTVLDEYLSTEDNQKQKPNQNFNQSSSSEQFYLLENENMSVAGYQDIINGPLSQYIALSNQIGGDVAQHARLVKAAFDAQLQYINYASQYAQPPQNKQMELLKPTSDQITAIQDFREKNRASQLFNHLSAISESIPALGWVCVSPTPGPHVKEMNDAGQFYTNRVLKEWKEKDQKHVEWARAWIQTLTDLQKYIKQYHTTGLVWSGKGAVSANIGGVPPPPPPSAFGCPPPPPPPVAALGDLSLSGGSDDRSALFAEINQGEGITKNLKKVTDDMQTHKNPTLRTGPAPFKAPQYSPTSTNKSAPVQQQVDRPPVFARDGKKWLIEYQKSNHGLRVENAEMNNVVYVFRCQDSTLTIKGKINSVVMDSCKKCSILFDSVVSSVEFVNCQSVQMQVLGKVPTISIDKTDGCQMYLSKDSLQVEIISSKSSEMNVLIPKDNGDYIEQPIPEQYKTTIRGKALQTVCVESLG